MPARRKPEKTEEKLQPRAAGPGHSVAAPTRQFLPAYQGTATHTAAPTNTFTNGASTPNT